MIIILCTKNEQENIIDYQTYTFPDGNPEEWRGETVFAELLPDGSLTQDSLSLLGKARAAADQTDDKAQLLLIGDRLVETARDYFANGADRVFVYDDPMLKDCDIERYTTILMHFINNYKPASIYFEQPHPGKELSTRIIESVKQILPFKGETLRKEPVPEPLPLDSNRRGELVICEIP